MGIPGRHAGQQGPPLRPESKAEQVCRPRGHGSGCGCPPSPPSPAPPPVDIVGCHSSLNCSCAHLHGSPGGPGCGAQRAGWWRERSGCGGASPGADTQTGDVFPAVHGFIVSASREACGVGRRLPVALTNLLGLQGRLEALPCES